ncbi:MAG: flavin reductase family protein [Pseudomonadota bacterium]|nr:flavin reductase family protein [Pseudomonadota bacterium]
MIYETESLLPLKLYQLLVGGIIQRPIAWISSQNKDGVTNLAPYSFFSVASCNPPILTITHVNSQSSIAKDTLTNLLETNECVVNVVTELEIENMNLSCASYPANASEIDELGIETVESKLVKPPSIKASPVRYECRLRESLSLSDQPLGGVLILLDVVAVYVDNKVIEDDLIQADLLKLVGKLGSNDYCRANTGLTLKRPVI